MVVVADCKDMGMDVVIENYDEGVDGIDVGNFQCC